MSSLAQTVSSVWRAAAAAAALFAVMTFAEAQSPSAGWTESFETEGISWIPLYQINGVRLVEQVRSSDFPHSGRQSERLTLDFSRENLPLGQHSGPSISSSGCCFLGHYVDYPLLVDETGPSVWVRTEGVPVTLGVLVVLPKTIRPDTRTPLTLLLSGSTSSGSGQWEELTFGEKLHQELELTVQAIRFEHKIAINTANAYIRQVILFAEAGRGKATVWVDDLRITEHASRPLEFLRQEEKNARFDPINLLAFRFKATGSTIAVESADTTLLPEEPFGIGQNAGTADEEKPEERLPSFMRGDITAAVARPQNGLIHDSPEAIRQTAFEARPGNIPQTSDEAAIISGSGTRPTGSLLADSFPEPSEDFPEIRFNQQFLTFNGTKPIAIRAVEYQGEPFSFLKGLQFNAIWLKTPPTREQLSEARQNRLWLIAPPPVGGQTIASTNSTPADPPEGVLPYFNRAQVDSAYDPVIAWDFGSTLNADQAELVRRSAEFIHRLDTRQRPIIGRVATGVVNYTSYGSGIDAIVLERRPMLGSLDFSRYGRWLSDYQKIGEPGYPYWNEIQTEPDSSLLAQCRFFGATDELPGIVSYEQMRQQVRLSLAAGIHGLIFSSSSALCGPDHESQYRAAALELINLELLLIDSWFASGSAEEMIDSEDGTIGAAILTTERTSLLLPLSTESDSQFVFSQGAATNRSFIVPARDGCRSDLLLPGAIRTVPSHRKAGGIHLDMDEISMNSLVYMAQSEWYTRVTAEKCNSVLGKRMAELAIRLAKMRLDLFRETIGTLQQMEQQGGIPTVNKRSLLPLTEQTTVLLQACESIAQAEDYYNQNDFSQAYLEAERSTREIRGTAHRLRKQTTRFDQNVPVLPVSISFETLPAYIDTYGKITSRRVKIGTENRLVGGDMERADDWSRAGWSRQETLVPGIESHLNRSGEAAHSGSFGLLFTLTSTESVPPAELSNPPLAVSVSFPVHTGEMLCVEGWIAIPQTLTSGVDGFMVYDNHGGIALAQRYRDRTGWRPFAFYRFAAWDGEMTLTFAMSGLGTVKLDDVSVRTVSP